MGIPACVRSVSQAFASASVGSYKNLAKRDDNIPTSTKASKQVVNKAVKMTLPRVNAPADVSG